MPLTPLPRTIRSTIRPVGKLDCFSIAPIVWISPTGLSPGAAGTAVTDVIRLLIVAETRLYREGLVRLLGSLRRVQVVASAGDLEQTIGAMNTAAPIDVALIDMGMSDGAEVIERILQGSPRSRAVAMAIHDLPDDLVAAATAGATGYLSRDAAKEELVEALYRTSRGEVVCSSSIAATLVRFVAHPGSGGMREEELPLTSRERQIVELITQGMSNKEIARRLYIALPTVKNHIHHILEKLEVPRRMDVALRVGPMPGMADRFRS